MKLKTYLVFFFCLAISLSFAQAKMSKTKKAIIASVEKTGCVVTAEEHNHLGGLGESVSRVLSQNKPTPQEFVATNDTFGESGTPAQLMEKYGLNANAIVKACEKAIKRK